MPSTPHTLTAVLIDEDQPLTLEELAQACAAQTSWLIERAESGLLGESFTVTRRTEWRFESAQLQRARRLLQLERDMEANPDVAALVADLVDEVQRLRRRLRAAGIAD